LLKNSVAGILAFADRNGIASNRGIPPDRTNQFRNVVTDEFSIPAAGAGDRVRNHSPEFFYSIGAKPL
jgi:hypothetical protein